MKICILGTGTWGFCLGNLLAGKGCQIISWTKNQKLATLLTNHGEHPHLPGSRPHANMQFTTEIQEALEGAECIVESVTTAGVRTVLAEALRYWNRECPIVITSKGIEQGTLLTLPDLMIELLGETARRWIGCLSGPSYAHEVVKGLPTSVVGSAFNSRTMYTLCDLFTTGSFRVYPNSDIKGVAYGGALKNVIAIACGISDGLKLGNSSKAALMTRGLHEIKKLAMAQGCKGETFSGLSGMGDICLTCGSLSSRNCRFGYLIAQGMSPAEAEREIAMVVEGAYTCISALQLSKRLGVPMPITEAVHKILYEGMLPIEAVQALMQRTIKQEHL